MEEKEWQENQRALYEERYELSSQRLQSLAKDTGLKEEVSGYFRTVASFLVQAEEVFQMLESGEWEKKSLSEMQKINEALYRDLLGEHYAKSWANPSFAEERLGEYGPFLSALYAEMRGTIPYAFEQRMEYLTILQELFLEIYTCFELEETPELKHLKKTFYWYASDYSDVFLAERVREQIDPSKTFALDIIQNSDLEDARYLYRYGEYITENELGTLRHLLSLPKETLQKMADVYTEGYRIGFKNTGKDLSKKSTVNIRYSLGFEPVIRLAAENFEKMGLKPTIYRAAVSVITKREQHKIGYYGAIANHQYEYDHRQDEGLLLDKRYVERKLDVTRNVYEQCRQLAAGFAGPACMEIFGEKPFSPAPNSSAITLTEEQRELALLYTSKAGQLTNQYIRGDERSFTIVAYPIPEIGEKYEAIFDEVIKINTLDAKLYETVQQTLIDALDQGEYVHILGKGANGTDLKVQLYRLKDPEKETIFENCVADVNIPVGEVFTSPVLKGTDGVLAVSKVYLNGLQYLDLKLTFKDGQIADYTCANFASEEENRAYIEDNILQNHKTLPMGEFAIGTNTTAYVAGKKYQIEDKMPILIAEKTGPHFAVGDTCYSWSEDVKVYNPNGKEIVAKENEISAKRKENPASAYFQCHTDITIPYEELEEISVVTKNGNHIILLKNGRFVLEGTEILNEPLKELGL